MPGYYYYSSAGSMWWLVVLIIGMVVSVIAQIKIKSTYSKYGKISNSRGITGAQAARSILDSHGLYNVAVVPINGHLTDNYDPRRNTVSLSQGVYDSSSIAAIGVAAHEVGHAIQHQEGYTPIKLRSSLVPVVNFGSRFSPILILLGIALSAASTSNFGYWIAVVGVVLFAGSTVFHLVTLPVEFNASRRAGEQLEAVIGANAQDIKGVRKMLSAAAMTYVGSMIVSLGYLLRMIAVVSGSRRNN